MCSLPNHGLQSRVQDGKGTQTGMHRSQNVKVKFMLLVGTQLISYQLKVQASNPTQRVKGGGRSKSNSALVGL